MKISVEKLSFAYPECPRLFDAADISFAEGKLNVLLGANGCGKSTLLKLLCGILTPAQGEIILDGKPLTQYSAQARARRIALMSQQPAVIPDLSVSELVQLGRYPRHTSRQIDREAVTQAMSDAGISAFAQRKLHTLSGGEKARAFFALALAQESEILLLDEPAAALDPGNAYTFFKMLRKLAAEKNLTIIAALHQIEEAVRYGDRLIGLRGGKALFAAPPAEVKSQILSLYDGFDADFNWELWQ